MSMEIYVAKKSLTGQHVHPRHHNFERRSRSEYLVMAGWMFVELALVAGAVAWVLSW